MNVKRSCIASIFFFSVFSGAAQEKRGAIIPWTTYEAELMHNNGKVLGPKYEPYLVETESSGQRCVILSTNQQYVEFVATANANTMIIRFSLPDDQKGDGSRSTLAFYKNGRIIQHNKVSSRYSWLYGKYPFTNDSASGYPRNFYDEIRLKNFDIQKGDVIRIQRANRKNDDAKYCIIDLIDLESIAPPLRAPYNSLSVTDKSFLNAGVSSDYTDAFKNCIAEAERTGKSIWIPPGIFKITGDIILPANITIQGAGMWYTELVGGETQYTNVNKRVRIKGIGSNIHISDFAIIGKLNYRSDAEPNDGIVGSFGVNSTISRIWIEHTKVGMWIENSSRLKITGCRMRNTMADGINFCVGIAQSTIEDCTARGTGDDCFAIWPAVFAKQQFSPGHNLIIHCTGQLPYLANGAAIYGGESNRITNSSFGDISQGSAILISTTFPTESKTNGVNNNFSGTTVIENCDIKTSGGFDHEWDWRAAIEICLDKRSISGIQMHNVNIENSLSNGLSVIAKNEPGKIGTLLGCTIENVTISNYGVGTKNKNALLISDNAHGDLIIKNSHIAKITNESADLTITQ